MIRIRIAGLDRDFSDDLRDLDESWINQHINRRKADGLQVCVQVEIEVDSLHILLTTPGCPTGGGGRSPNAREQEVFELWRKLGLDSSDFSGGNVIAFLKQMRRNL